MTIRDEERIIKAIKVERARSVIALSPAEMRFASAIRAGASSVAEIAASAGTSRQRILNALRFIGDKLGVPRAARRHGREVDVAAVIAAVRAAEGFVARPLVYSARTMDGDDRMPARVPLGLPWPDYGPHNLSIPA